jgi:hypothetical protein
VVSVRGGSTVSRYAEGTRVTPEKSQQQIAALLRRYGASSYASAWEQGRAMIAFGSEDRHVRIVLALPHPDDPEFRTTPSGRPRDPAARQTACKAEIWRRWRALALGVKAKLEAVETGIETFEEAFMAHIVLPDGRTVAEHVQPAIAHAYRTGEIRPFIPSVKAIEAGSQ